MTNNETTDNLGRKAIPKHSHQAEEEQGRTSRKGIYEEKLKQETCRQHETTQ